MTSLNLNMNFTERVYAETTSMSWEVSPSSGVFRKRLEAENSESKRATAIVKYSAGSSFHSHTHHGGEEFLVLDGVFSDEKGNYPAGTYVRNPPGSVHTPFSEKGCVIFVKLCQMPLLNTTALSLDISQLPTLTGSVVDHSVFTLYQSEHEWVQIETFGAGVLLDLPTSLGGYEFLVLAGDLLVDGRQLNLLSWGRIPAGMPSRLESKNGCTLWSKQRHLASL